MTRAIGAAPAGGATPSVAAAAGVGLAVLVRGALPPGPGWIAALAIALIAAEIADRLVPVRPVAGQARTRPGGSRWLLLLIAAGGAAVAGLSAGPPLAGVAGVAALLAALADFDRRRTGFADDAIAAQSIALAAILAGVWAWVGGGVPPIALAVGIGLMAAIHVFDQVSGGRLHRRSIYAYAAGLILAQLALFLGFLPIQPWVEVGLIVLIVYVLAGVFSRAAADRLTARGFWEYGVLLAAGLLAAGVFGR